MSKLWLVALNEYKRNAFKRSFLLVLLSMPLMIGVLASGLITAHAQRLREQIA